MCVRLGLPDPAPGTNEMEYSRTVPPPDIPMEVVREAQARGIDLPGVVEEPIGSGFFCDEHVEVLYGFGSKKHEEYEPYRRRPD